jgi:hypothetical protein
VSAVACGLGIGGGHHRLVQSRMIRHVHLGGVIHFDPNVLALHLGIIYVYLCLLVHEIANNKHRGRLTYVASILLGCESEYGDLLPGDGIEHGGYHLLQLMLLLIIVHDDDLIPVLGAFPKTVGLA